MDQVRASCILVNKAKIKLILNWCSLVSNSKQFPLKLFKDEGNSVVGKMDE